MNPTTPAGQRLVAALQRAGVEQGDTVLVHSDSTLAMRLSGAKWWDGAIAFLFESFEELLGPDGTLVVPTFNYDFCEGKPYDHALSPSQMGMFSTGVLRSPRAVRSLHPIYSFAAVGPQAERLCGDVGKSSFGEGTVFDRLHRINAGLVFFNVSFEFCTFVHHVEQAHGVDYRYFKDFTGEITAQGRTYEDTFDFYVRDLDRGVDTCMTPLGERLERLGLMRRVGIDTGYVLHVRCMDVYDQGMQMLDDNSHALMTRSPG